ncbi:VirB8/TrbF family protein [Zophobihabitans entericus]|uniref:Conjugal transfer protein TrbF n=1 Tax=Zophobihabitans entericus TaxID=1635327 RepID=A0A6G9IFD0_9GAMM|nr:VirB8/TrbF family protein [Zophobihabitans entericus]QIQ22519.1 conjugal transfer protein TrbF [Zophobihabitans entericus]
MNLKSLFKKKEKVEHEHVSTSKGTGEDKEELNPYLNARRAWNSHCGSLMSSRLSWQVVGIIALLISLYAVYGIISIGSQSKFIPYIVEHNVSTGRVSGGQLAYPAERPEKIMFQAAVSDYIFYSRLVTADAAMQRKAVFKVYSMLTDTDPAFAKMNEWMRADGKTPFERAAKELVSIEIRSVLPQTADTWQIEWVETTRDRQGALVGTPFIMRALVTVYQAEPKSEKTLEDMNNNPVNIYVRDFSWSRLN